MADWRGFLKQHSTAARSDVSFGIGLLIELAGTAVEKLDELKEIVMTSAASMDAEIQAATASLVTAETALQTTATTLENDLKAILADITASANAGNTVQPATLAALQGAVTTAGTIGTSFSAAVGQLDAAVNPPAPAPATPPASGS